MGNSCTIVAYAASILLNAVLCEETKWQICAACVYPRIFDFTILDWIVPRKPCVEMFIRTRNIDEMLEMSIQVFIGKLLLLTSVPILGCLQTQCRPR